MISYSTLADLKFENTAYKNLYIEKNNDNTNRKVNINILLLNFIYCYNNTLRLLDLTIHWYFPQPERILK